MTTLDLAELERSLEALHLSVPLPVINSADVLSKPLDICRIYLAAILSSIADCGIDDAYKCIQWPNNIYNGDLAVVLPRLCPNSKAAEAAFDLAKKFPQGHPLFPLPFLEGVHFRIFLNTSALARLLVPFIIDRGNTYGDDARIGLRNPPFVDGERKKLLIESSSPNITNEFQGKHLRSTILGAFVGKLYENMGWDVTRMNYLGDWGKNIALLKVGWERFGDEGAYRADPIGHLLEVYHRIDELFQPEVTASKQARDEAARSGRDEGEAQAEIQNQGIHAERDAASKKLEEGDEETVAFWKRVRNINIENYKDFYAQLGVHYDEYTGESEVIPDTMLEIEQMLKEKNICKESGGAWVVHMQDYGLRAGTAIIRYRTGAPTYLLRELAAVVDRSRKYEFDKMIIVAASDQNSHFTYLHHILIALDMEELAGKIQHLKFNVDSKMADHFGKEYRPQAIVGHCEEAMVPVLEADQEKVSFFGDPVQGAKALGVAALITHELSTRTSSVQSFDLNAMTTFKIGTGPDIQYWYARLCLVLEGHDTTKALSEADYDALEDEDLLRLLAQYPEVTHAAYNSLEPAAIITYLTSIIEQLSNSFDEEEGTEANANVKQADEEVDTEKGDAAEEGSKTEDAISPCQLALYEATRVVLENAMRLLGLNPYTRLKQERADTPVAD